MTNPANPEVSPIPEPQKVTEKLSIKDRINIAYGDARNKAHLIYSSFLRLKKSGIDLTEEEHVIANGQQELDVLQHRPELENKDTQTDPIEEKMDTDDPQARLLRIVNQHKLELHLQQTFDRSLLERMGAIRKIIFDGFPNVRGQEASELRTQDLRRGLGLIPLNYASADLLNARFMPDFNDLINELSGQIKHMDNSQRTNAALNLASVIYTLGVPLHPYGDGNGQTFRLVALSYLHELAPSKFGDYFFPFKPTNTGKNMDNNLQTPIISRLFHINSSNVYTDEELKKEWALRSGLIFDDTQEGFHKVTDKEMQEMFPNEEAKETIREKFRQNEAKHASLVAMLMGSHQSQTNIHFFLDYMLHSEEGKTFIREYVLHPDIFAIKDPANTPWYQRNAADFFSGISTDIKNILETREIHEAKFEDAKKLALQNYKLS